MPPSRNKPSQVAVMLSLKGEKSVKKKKKEGNKIDFFAHALIK